MTHDVTRNVSTTPTGGSLAQALSAQAKSSAARRKTGRSYDFRRPTKLSREHVRVLQIAQEAFARQGTTVLTLVLRTGARMDLVDIEQVGYDDYVATLPNPTFLATFTLDPLPGKGLLAFPLDMAMACVEHMLGGAGTAEQPSRAMTGMESRVLGHLLDRLLTEFGVAFSTITSLQPELDAFEYNPALAQTAAGSETVMITRYTFKVGLREAEATLCLPFPSFAAALKSASSPQLSASDRAKRAKATEALIARLNQVPVDVGVRFHPLTMSSRDLASLSVGDVIELGHAKDSPLQVTTNDEIFAYAMSGNHRRRLAAQIVSTPTLTDKETR